MVISQKDGKWESVRLGDYSQVFRGGSPRPIQNYLTNSSQGINWIKIGDTRKGEKYITNTVEKIIAEGVSKSREVFAGDLLLSNSMSFGRPYILKINGCIHDGWLVIQDYQNSFDTQYLYYSLLTDSVKMQFNNLAAGSGVHNLNKEIVSNIILNKPNKGEQVSIATILSEIDKLIYNLEKLIEKKKNIKQGAMQELLTGKRRLPGFDGKWTKVQLSQVLSYEQPTNYIVSSTDYSKTGTPVITAGKSFILGYTTDDIGICSSVPIILFDDFLTLSRYIDFPFKVKSSAVKLLSLKSPNYDLHFIFEIMQRISFPVLEHQRHWISQYSKIEITIPKTKEEQTAIATVLSDMDKEIEELEKKLEKYRYLKQGMMSELLTGHIRLTEKEDA